MERRRRRWLPGAGALAALLVHAACAAPASALEVLEAVDHAELRARVSATEVTRIALAGDRIVRVIRAPGGFEAEHDPARGDLYLRPLAVAGGRYGEEAAPSAECQQSSH